MKVAVLLAYAVLTTRRAICASIQTPVDLISLEDISDTDRRYLDYLNNYYNYPSRPKRSGEDALNSLKATIGHGIKSKLSQLAKGSASASAHFSKGSSSSGHSYDYHHDVPDHDHKSFDLWSLKKSILNTLLQAVKAIKGGVIAIKGQLIKGSGYLISAKGKLISSKGEAITKLGKNIATSAVLSPAGHSEEYSHGHYHHSDVEEYGSPSAPGPEYEVPEHHYHHHHHSPHHEDKRGADHAGILILKKIPVHHEHSSEHLPAEHKLPEFKPIDHKGPSFGEIIGKFFSASTSLKPGVPSPFGDHHHEPDHHDEHEHHHHDDHEHHHHDDHSSHEEYHHESHPSHSSHADSHHEYSSPVHTKSHDSPQSSGIFEEVPDYVNHAEYASESKGTLQAATQPPEIESKPPQAQKLQALPQKFDEIRPLPNSFGNIGFDTTSFLSDSDKSNLYGGSYLNNPSANFPQLSLSLPSIQPTNFATDTSTFQFGGFPNPGIDSNFKYLAPQSNIGPQVFPPPDSFKGDSFPSYPQRVKVQGYLNNLQSASFKNSLKRPTRSRNTKGPKRPPYPSPSIVKSVSYHLGPQGPKRL